MDGAEDEGKLLLIRGRRNKLALGVAGVIFLGVGAMLAPAEDHSKPTTEVPSEPVAPLLQAERREPFPGLRDVLASGEAFARHTVAITWARETAAARSRADTPLERAPSPVVTGVVVRPGVVLASGASIRGDVARLSLLVTDGGARRPARLVGCDAETGLILLAVDGLATPVAPLQEEDVAVGSWAIATTRSADGARSVPAVTTTLATRTVQLGLGQPTPGAAIAAAEGRLLGVHDHAGVVWRAAPAMASFESRAHAVRSTLGLSIQPITEDLEPAFGGPGVVVADAPASGPIQPGDEIVAIGTRDIAGIAAFEEALATLAPGEEIAIAVARQGRRLDLRMRTSGTCVFADPVVTPPHGPRADALFAAEERDRAGLPADAVVLSIDGGDPVPGPPRRRRPTLVRAQHGTRPPAFYRITK